MKRISVSLFLAVLFVFSAVLTILSLFSSIKLAALGDEAARLTKQAEQLSGENELLAAKAENAFSLEELENYAVNVLGMQRCTAHQIEFVEMSEPAG